MARLHYADKKAGIDHWETWLCCDRIDDAMPAEVWSGSEPFDDCVPELDKAPEAGARFAALPAELSRAKSYPEWTKSLKNYLYRERTLRLWTCPALKEYSKAEEPEREFRLRLVQASREERDQKVEALRAKYTPKLAAIQEQIRLAHERLEREQAQASRSTWDATIAMGSSVLGALLGRKALSKTNLTKATTAAKAASRAMQQARRCQPGRGFARSLRQKYNDLQTEFQAEIESSTPRFGPRPWVSSHCRSGPRKRISPSRKSSWPGCRISSEPMGSWRRHINGVFFK